MWTTKTTTHADLTKKIPKILLTFIHEYHTCRDLEKIYHDLSKDLPT